MRVFIFKFCTLYSPGTSDLQPLPVVEALAWGALQTVIGVGRRGLGDHHTSTYIVI